MLLLVTMDLEAVICEVAIQEFGSLMEFRDVSVPVFNSRLKKKLTSEQFAEARKFRRRLKAR